MGKVWIDAILPVRDRHGPTVVSSLDILCVRVTGKVTAGHVALGTCEVEPEVAFPCELLTALLIHTCEGLRQNACATVVGDGLEIIYSIDSSDGGTIDKSLSAVEIHLGEPEDDGVVDIGVPRPLPAYLPVHTTSPFAWKRLPRTSVSS